MKYWALFTLRMIARVGLATAVILWGVGLLKPKGDSDVLELTTGSYYIIVATADGKAGFYLCDLLGRDYPMMAMQAQPEPAVPTSNWPGLKFWSYRHRTGYAYLLVDHWFLLGAFLLATVATRKRTKSDSPPVEPETVDEP